MAIREFKLPDPGEGLVEADIVTWRVAVGDQVKINDILLEVETSKSLVELPSPYAGTVSALLVNEGDTVGVGTAIIAIDDSFVGAQPTAAGAQPPTAAPAPATAPAPPDDLIPSIPATEEDEEIEAGKIGGVAPGGRVAVLVGYGPKTTEAKRRPRKSSAAQPDVDEAHAQVANTFSTHEPVSRRADHRAPLPPTQAEAVGGPLPGPGARVAVARASEPPAILAKPPVRKLAKDLGVDLAALTGSGEGGVITRDDVEAAAGDRAMRVGDPAVSLSNRSSTGSGLDGVRADVRIPIKGVRKATAEAMVSSAFTAPHVTEWLTVDVTASVSLLDRIRQRREFADVKISPLLLVAKAACLALARTPELNSSWDEAAREIVLKGAVNLGIAAATPRGLMVPNIKDAGTLGTLDLAQAINALVATARDGKTQPADLARGTFTITNVGVFGVDAGTPILNPGEAGILCIGQIARRPWVVGSGPDERIEPRSVMTLSLSFDHRLADGEQGSRFLADVAGVLADPGLALLY